MRNRFAYFFLMVVPVALMAQTQPPAAQEEPQTQVPQEQAQPAPVQQEQPQPAPPPVPVQQAQPLPAPQAVQVQEKPDALKMYRAGQYLKAMEVCHQELALEPRNMDSYSVLGWCLLKLKRYQEALTQGTKAHAIAPYDVRIIEILGEAYFYLNRNAQALKYLQDYAAMAPRGERIDIAYYLMGEIFMRLQEFNHADIAFTAAVYQNPHMAFWWSRLGFAREKAKNYRLALQAYDNALKRNPNLLEAQQGKTRMRSIISNG